MSAMGMNMHLGQRQELRQFLAPRMIQSMEILQLSVMALEERLQQELENNPALELRELTPDDFRDEPGDAPAQDDRPDEMTVDFNKLDVLESSLDEPLYDDLRPSRSSIEDAGERKMEAMANAPSRPKSLQDYLEEQLSYIEAPPDQLDLMRYVIAHIDSRGYLDARVPKGTDPLVELARCYTDRAVTRDDVEDALMTIQKCDPPGVGARDLKECLHLQIDKETKYAEVVLSLVNHLDDVRTNRLPALQKATGFEIDELQLAIEVLKRLNPNPGSKFDSEHIPYVTPDVVVDRNEKGEFEIRLVDDWIPEVHVPRSIIEMSRTLSEDPKARKYLKSKIQAATWLIEAVQQRKNTLEKVTRAIVERQKSFFDNGPDFIEPLKLQDIADVVKIHVTTVSRAVDEKWVQTPRGIFPLKRFFGGGTTNAAGESVAYETMKNKLTELVSNEDKSVPLSDEDIVKRFSEIGYPVARRTVTKYRKLLNIPSSRERRDWSLDPK